LNYTLHRVDRPGACCGSLMAAPCAAHGARHRGHLGCRCDTWTCAARGGLGAVLWGTVRRATDQGCESGHAATL